MRSTHEGANTEVGNSAAGMVRRVAGDERLLGEVRAKLRSLIG
jgi:hypothetical protein